MQAPNTTAPPMIPTNRLRVISTSKRKRLGNSQPHCARPQVVERERQDVAQPAADDTKLIRDVVSVSIKCPGTVPDPRAQIRFPIGGKVLPLRSCRKDVHSITNETHCGSDVPPRAPL